MSINTNSDSVKNTQLTKENKEMERARFKCFQGGGVFYGAGMDTCAVWEAIDAGTGSY